MMCFRYTKLLVPYSEGGLDARMRARVKRHLEVCKNCAADLRAIQSVGQALTRSDNFATEPAPDLWAKVNARITSRPVRRHPTARSWALRIASAAAAAVLMAVVASSIMRPHLPAKSQMALVRHVIPAGPGGLPTTLPVALPEPGRPLHKRVGPTLRARPAPRTTGAVVAKPAVRKVRPPVVVAMASPATQDRIAALRPGTTAPPQTTVDERLISNSPAPSSSPSNGSSLSQKGADEVRPSDRENSIALKDADSGTLYRNTEGTKHYGTQASGIALREVSAAKSTTADMGRTNAVQAASAGAKDNLAGIVKKVMESIVKVQTERNTRARSSDFLSDGSPVDIPVIGVCFGYIVDAKCGYVLTAEHAVTGAKRITVTFSNGKESKARLIGADRLTDAALIQVDTHNRPALEMGDSDTIRKGSTLLTILNVPVTADCVSQGTVLSTTRTLADNNLHFIQISTMVGPGMSGGPVFDLSGRVVGVARAIMKPPNSPASGLSHGFLFVTPINAIKAELPGLKAEKPTRHD